MRVQTIPVLGFAEKDAHQTSFKGALQVRGHRGSRGASGRWTDEAVREDGTRIVRKRWSTSMDVEVLDILDKLSKSNGLHRNEIVEQIVRAYCLGKEI